MESRGNVFAAAFADTPGETVRFPTDDELLAAILARMPQYDVMPTPRLRYILFSELEKASRDKFDETVALRDDLTIEHVLPNKWAEHWPSARWDGAKAPRDHVVSADDPRHGAIHKRETG